jgi:hypothetical protein
MIQRQNIPQMPQAGIQDAPIEDLALALTQGKSVRYGKM